MKCFLTVGRGIRALFIELLGVLVLLWLLYPFKSISNESIAREDVTAPLPQLAIPGHDAATHALESKPVNNDPRARQRREFVAQELEYASRLLDAVVRSHMDRLFDVGNSPPAETRIQSTASRSSMQ